MMTKDEFLALYEKYMRGQCTDAEKRLLETYRDDMLLAEDGWDDQQADEAEVRARIWQRLGESRGVGAARQRKLFYNRWFQVAAILVVALAAGLLFIPTKKHITGDNKLAVTAKPKPIVPGSDKAYLTLADGSKIVLDDAKNGALANQSGVKVSKSSNGVVVYAFNKSGQNKTDNNTPTEFNTITTPRGGQYQVILGDGTHVWLNAASSIRFPQSFNGPERLVELNGEAYFEVAKDKTHPFIVQANGAKVQVYGTHFDVNAYSDNNNVTATLLEGSIKLSNNSQATMLVPGQQGVSALTGGAINVSKADIQQTVAWKNGLFIFHDLNIREVMKQVGRWYDVDIEYKDEDVKSNEFGGTISRYKSITELLDNMQLTKSIHYKIEGRRVIIMR